MYSYVALTWDVRDDNRTAAGLQQQLRTLREFQVVYAAPGICIAQKAGLHSACGALVLPDQGGAILGTLFSWPVEGAEARRQLSMTAQDSANIVASNGEYLVKRFWGRYLAFIRTVQGQRYAVVRDPSGMLPCFRVSHHGVQVWFSRMEDLAALGLEYTAIDWHYLETHVVARSVKSHGTGLLGIEEVRAGERWEIEAGEVKRSAIWDAVAVSNDVLEDAAEAARRLRETTKACVNAWAGCYESVLQALSGGLDSSIVTVLLGQTPTATAATCVNYYTRDAEGDERQYARLSAQKAGFELLEKLRVPRLVDLRSMLRVTPTPNPWVYLYHVEHADYEFEQAHRHGARAVFTGGGGDGVFYQSRASFAVADYVQRHGLTLDLLGIALDAAQLEGKSLLTVLRAAFADRQRKSRRQRSVEQANLQTLVSPDVVASQAVKLQAIFDGSSRQHVPLGPVPIGPIPIGKWWQIQSTSTPPSFYDQLGDPLAVERVPPLVSQPIVELCLKIPTYVLVENGWDRAIARRAFEADLPRAVVNRRGKGGLETHVREVFGANIEFIRELLLDGELARRGILNREHLEACLSGTRTVGAPEITEMQDHLSTEAWIACHSRKAQTSAAA